MNKKDLIDWKEYLNTLDRHQLPFFAGYMEYLCEKYKIKTKKEGLK